MAVDLKKIRQRYKRLQDVRNPFDGRYRDLARYILPDSGRFNVNENPLDEERWDLINDPTATDAVDVLAAGMLSGMTSPARPWFRLTTGDRDLDDRADIKRWLYDVTEEMQKVFLQSNVYQALIQSYEELAVFGTSCMVALPSPDTVIHLHTMTVGEYWIAENSEKRVDTLYRRFTMTAEQMVGEFGYEACSRTVRTAWDKNDRYKEFVVVHAIEPRDDFVKKGLSNKTYPYVSVYFEESSGKEGENKVLLEEGYSNFPGLCPRWSIHGGSVYGTSPGMKALRQIKGLQVEALRKAQGIDIQSNPPMIFPGSMEEHQIDFAPGGVSFYADGTNPQQAYPAIAANVNLQHLIADIQDMRNQINGFFYKDLFTLIMSTPRTNRTAYEVEQMVQERMAILGPVLQRLNKELLRPLIAMALFCMQKYGRMPEPPEDISDVDVTFESILMQALRSSGISSADGFVALTLNLAQARSDVLDNVDLDVYIQESAELRGVNPKYIRSREEVDAIRESRAQEMERQNQMAREAQMIETAKGIADLNPAATQAQGIGQLQGY